MSERRDPFADADDTARTLAQTILNNARFASLAVIDPATGGPGISRISFATDEMGIPLTLVSSLAAHHAALRANPDAALMIGEPGVKGDPLTHPRLMLNVRAHFVERASPDQPALRTRFLSQQPKAALYIDFADFDLVLLIAQSAILNGGFGRAWRMTAEDLGKP